ncbi:MAG: TolC family protein [Gemmatimonadetes bacterium]|nr:TolC family protein [Gemmatimonadota bacterium]
MYKSIYLILWILIAIAVPQSPLASQETRSITLQDALAIAASSGPGVSGAAALAEAARQGRRREAAGLLPEVGIEFGAMRTSDPVAAFGSRLRQGRFTAQDFAPELLNDPAALTDWSAALGLAWAPLDAARMAAVAAADATADAAALTADWSVRSASFLAEVRFIEAVGAESLLHAADAAVSAAEENLSLVGRRVEEGLLVEADRLRAQAAVETARASRIDAARLVEDTRGRLGLALGWPGGVVPIPLDDPAAVGSASGQTEELASRLDIQASGLAVQAADARLKQAQRARLPNLSGFARLESHAADPFSGTRNNWTVGVQLRMPVFTGFAISAAERAGRAHAEAAAEAHSDRLREAEATVAEARRAVDAATGQTRASDAAHTAAQEVARLVGLRFTEGLATTSDLLAAEASAASSASAALRAQLGRRLAIARLSYLTDVASTTNDLKQGPHP